MSGPTATIANLKNRDKRKLGLFFLSGLLCHLPQMGGGVVSYLQVGESEQIAHLKIDRREYERVRIL